MATSAQYDSTRISPRTAVTLPAARERGARFGHPRSLPADVVGRVVRQRTSGAPLAVIATELDLDGIPTAQGDQLWNSATVAAVLLLAALEHAV